METTQVMRKELFTDKNLNIDVIYKHPGYGTRAKRDYAFMKSSKYKKTRSLVGYHTDEEHWNGFSIQNGADYVQMGAIYHDKQKNIQKHRFNWIYRVCDLGRKECVHHLDGDKTNNDISNLATMSLSEHKRYHWANKDINFMTFIEFLEDEDYSITEIKFMMPIYRYLEIEEVEVN